MKNIFLLFSMMLIASIGFSQTSLPLDFENGPYTFNDFDGGITTVITNPQSAGINTSANVAEQVRNGGATWGGGWILLDSYLDFTTNNTFTMKVYSPAIGLPVLLKLEGDGGVNTELTVNTTVADEWEVLTYGFAGQPSDTYNKLVFIFNMGTTGAGEVYLFDDVEFIDGSGGLSQIDLPVTFEEADVDYTLTDFGGNVSSLVADPEDATNTVAKVIRGNEGWSGTTIGTPAGFATDIPITMEDSKMYARVWAPAAGIPVMMKIESLATSTCETVTNTTVSGWQVLEFNFLNERSGTESLQAGINYGWTYHKASIFFDFQVDPASVTTVGETYYFDDIFFGGTVLSSEPTVAAPTPPVRNAGDVISIFSDAYTNVSGTDFNPDWGQSTTVTTENIDSNPTLKYANFNYQGTALGTTQDVSTMEFIHIDMWTYDATNVQIAPISGAGEYLVSLSPIVSESWESYEFPLSDFGGNGVDLTDIFQLKFDGQGGTNPSTIYLDNIYFYKAESSSIEMSNKNNFTVYPNPAIDIITVSNNVTVNSINIYTIHGQKVNVKMISENTIDISGLAVGLYTITVTDKLGNISTNKIIKM